MKTTAPVHELFLNYACSAKCPFCYNPPITQELLRLDLSFEQAAASLYKAAKAGLTRLNLHGGEVTLRDDLPKLLALARKLGFSEITLVTNGIRLGIPEYVESLVASGLTHVRISVHAADAKTHDEIVAIPGAYEKVLQAVANVRDAGIPLGLNFVIIKKNVAKLPAFTSYFCGELGVDDVIVYFPHLRGMMALNADAQAPTYAEAAPFVRKAAARPGVLLANFPPCALPELAGRMLDWARDDHAPGDMTHPEGFSEGIGEMKDEQRAPVPACASCALEPRCLGVEREYVARYGAGEFAPVKREAAKA